MLLMPDLLYVLLVLAFFAACWQFAKTCAEL
jgi:hypothetical protein